LEILTSKKGAGYALFKMLMGISGKDHRGIFKFITLHKVRRAQGPSFLRNGGVTYVTVYGVAKQKPEFGNLIFLV
jgi:hypothetical protein